MDSFFLKTGETFRVSSQMVAKLLGLQGFSYIRLRGSKSQISALKGFILRNSFFFFKLPLEDHPQEESEISFLYFFS